jgi:hypothetical protein
MDKTRSASLIFVILLFLTLIFLLFKISILNQEKTSAMKLNDEVIRFFQQNDVPCAATNEEPQTLQRCLATVNANFAKGMLKETGFRNADTKNPGYIIMQNTGIKPLNSTDFMLLKNNNPIYAGCPVNGTLEKQETCKLTFTEPCNPGDFLEVTYEGKRAHIKNC